MNIVILAAGDFPSHPVPLGALREADFVVCCDSAYAEIRRSGIDPRDYVVIGDGDSLSDSDKRALGRRYLQVDEQDYNDLHKAMAFVMHELGGKSGRVTILGATGKREDHTLGNISYLVTFAEEYPGVEVEMLTDHGRMCALRGSRCFDCFPRQQVSIFSMDPATAVTSRGLKWPLEAHRQSRWWQATLNEAVGREFSLDADGWIVLFRTYEPKG